MFVTLKKNGIILPHSFFTVMQDFKPKHPPRAMEIREFDKMVVADQADYIQLLVDIAQKVLVHERNQDLAAKVHRLDLAAKVHRLFTEIPPGDKKSLGVAKFEGTLAQLRVAPEAEWVEDAMELTLSVNGIEVPYGSLTVDKDFKPKHPPKEKGK